MKEAHTRRSATNPNMSTKGRGKVLSTQRGDLAGQMHDEGGLSRAAVWEEPEHYVVGAHGVSVGGSDPDNNCDLDDFGANTEDD